MIQSHAHTAGTKAAGTVPATGSACNACDQPLGFVDSDGEPGPTHPAGTKAAGTVPATRSACNACNQPSGSVDSDGRSDPTHPAGTKAAGAVPAAVLVRRDSGFGLLRDTEELRHIWWRSLVGSLVASPPPEPREAINRFCRICWLALSEQEREWLLEGGDRAGRSPAQQSSEILSTASLKRGGCVSAEP